MPIYDINAIPNKNETFFPVYCLWFLLVFTIMSAGLPNCFLRNKKNNQPVIKSYPNMAPKDNVR